MSGYLNRLLRQSGPDAPGPASAPTPPTRPADPFAPEEDGPAETGGGDLPGRVQGAAWTNAQPVQRGIPPVAGEPAAHALPPVPPVLPPLPARPYPAPPQPGELEQALTWVSGGSTSAEDPFADPPKSRSFPPAASSPHEQPAPEPRHPPSPTDVAPPGSPSPTVWPSPTVSPRPGVRAGEPTCTPGSAPPAEAKASELRLSIGRIDLTVESSSANPPYNPPQPSWRAPSRLGRYSWKRR